MTLLDQLRQRRDTARQAAEQILTRAAAGQRDLTADELAEHRQHVTAEREAADEADRVRDEQIAELRATAARRTGPPAPRGPVLTREQNVEDWARARGLIPDDQPLSFDRYLKRLATGNWDGAEHERALSEGTLTAGGHLVPTPLSSRVIDLARNQTRVFQAGAITVPMTAQTLKLARSQAKAAQPGRGTGKGGHLMASIAKRPDGAYRARYYDRSGKQHAKHFRRKTDAQQWLDRETAKLVSGAWVDPKAAKITVTEWCRTWLTGYGTRQPGTVRQAEVHIAKITEEFGARRLDSIRPSEVKSWTAALHAEGLADSYIYAIHARLAQVLSDAVHDGVLTRSPVSRRTSPKAGKQLPYVASTEHIWELHDAMGERYRAGLLLAAFAGLRLAEVCGLRVSDVDFMRGIVNPALQYPADPLETEISRTAVPIPESLALTLSAHVAAYAAGGWLLTDETGHQLGPWQLQRAFRAARAKVDGLRAGFRFHDLRHYYASLLISSGGDVKVVQARLRHASAKTTLDTYAHLWPDSDDSTRAAVNKVLAARAEEIPEHPGD